MSVLFVVLPLAVLFSVLAVAVFLWAAQSGQFDDLRTPALRMLQDEARAGGERPACPPTSQDNPGVSPS